MLSQVLLAAVFTVHFSLISGGKEFEFDGKFYLMDQMEEINQHLKWEDAGPLDAIADRYATCESLDKKGMFPVNDLTPDGLNVVVVVDAGRGWETDFHSVQMYVRHVITRWVDNSTYVQQFEKSEGVACRMEPECEALTIVSCAFSYRLASDLESGVAGKPRAFTKDQYLLMEKLTGKVWDKSHFLENLASFDAKCSMVGAADWKFDETEAFTRRWNAHVVAEYGSAENTGVTDRAIVNVINDFSGDYSEFNRIGCCLIPDCTSNDGKTHIVVVCLYA